MQAILNKCLETCVPASSNLVRLGVTGCATKQAPSKTAIAQANRASRTWEKFQMQERLGGGNKHVDVELRKPSSTYLQHLSISTHLVNYSTPDGPLDTQTGSKSSCLPCLPVCFFHPALHRLRQLWFVALLQELYGKTCGFVGFGDIAQTTAKLCRALGMRVLGWRNRRGLPGEERGPCRGRSQEVCGSSAERTAKMAHGSKIGCRMCQSGKGQVVCGWSSGTQGDS